MTAVLPPPVVRAVVVADESLQRTGLVDALQRTGDIAVVGHATSARRSAQVIAELQPDVVLVDLDLLDGSSQEAVEQVMSTSPRPVFVLTAAAGDLPSRSLTAALKAGAVDSMTTPATWTSELGATLRRSVRQVSKVHVVRHPRAAARPVRRTHVAPAGQPPVVAVGASTGGPSALAILLGGLGGLRAPVLVVQHLHAEFTAGLLEWMSRASALPVSVAVHNEIALAGHVYLAPAKVHLRLAAAGRLELVAVPVTLHQPSADQLFHSVAERAGAAGVGVILTGMGDDGAQGLLALREQGGRTLGQDAATCAVFGMPRAADRLGAVGELLPLTSIAAAVQRAVAEVRT